MRAACHFRRNRPKNQPLQPALVPRPHHDMRLPVLLGIGDDRRRRFACDDLDGSDIRRPFVLGHSLGIGQNLRNLFRLPVADCRAPRATMRDVHRTDGQMEPGRLGDFGSKNDTDGAMVRPIGRA